METIIMMLVVSILNIVCFFIGAKVGQKVVNKEELKLPNLNPIQAVKNYETKKEEEKSIKEYQNAMDQIDNYKA